MSRASGIATGSLAIVLLTLALLGPAAASAHVQEDARARIRALTEEAAAALERGDGAAAEVAARRALELDPGYPVAMSFLGNALLMQQRAEDGLTWLVTATSTAPDLSSAWVGRARAELALSRTGDAIESLRQVIRLEPDDVAMRLQLVRTLHDAGRDEEALEAAGAAATLMPDSYAARALEASLAYDLGRYDRAITAFEAAAGARPDDPAPLRGLAAALVGAGRDEEAASLLALAAERFPNDAETLVAYGDLMAGFPRNFDARITGAQAYRAALSLRPGDRQLTEKLARAYVGLDLAAEGIALIDAFPGGADDPTLTLLRGRLLTRQQRYAEAREVYDRAIELGAGAQGWYYAAVAESNLGDLDASIEAFNRAIEADPGLAAAYRDRGKVLLDRGRYDDALASLRIATDMLPDDATAHHMAGSAALRGGSPAAALPFLRRAAELDPRDEQTAYTESVALRQLGRVDESREAIERFERLRGDAPNVGGGAENRGERARDIFRQGVARLRLVGPQAALPFFEQAIELDPEFAPAHYTAGLCHGYAADWQRAAELFERAVELDPERPDAYAGLAEAYSQLGRTEEAEAMLARAQELLAQIERR